MRRTPDCGDALMAHHISDEELEKIYDKVFDHHAYDENTELGRTHRRALRAVYEKGFEDGQAAAPSD